MESLSVIKQGPGLVGHGNGPQTHPATVIKTIQSPGVLLLVHTAVPPPPPPPSVQKPIESVDKHEDDSTMMSMSPSNSDSNSSSAPSASQTRGKPGRRSKSSPVEDPNDKKQRSLERNREAASRCRKKRKQWVQTLETKAQQLENSNSQLERDIAKLKNEVLHLKTALLAHKDCPVTLQQQMTMTHKDCPVMLQQMKVSGSNDNSCESNGMVV